MQWKPSVSKGIRGTVASWSFAGWSNVSGLGTGVRIQAGPHSGTSPQASLPPTLTQQKEIPQTKVHQEMPGMFKSALSQSKGSQLRARG